MRATGRSRARSTRSAKARRDVNARDGPLPSAQHPEREGAEGR